MLSYAGIPLFDPPAVTLAGIEATLDWAHLLDCERAVWPGGRRLGWAKYAQLFERFRRLQTLYWPRGASRWAVGYFLADKDSLDQIRQVAYYGASRYQSAALVMDDGTQSLTTNLFMLPPRPVHQIAGEGQLFVVTLVDERYFWWEKTGVIAYQNGPTAWDATILQVAAALGIAITRDNTAADYQLASTSIRSSDDALPLLLDTLAVNAGQRVVRKLDGTVLMQSYAQAVTSVTQQLANSSNVPFAGGQFLFDAHAANDLQGLVPASVTLLFQKTISFAPFDGVYPIAVTLASLNLPQFSGVIGHPGTKRFAEEAAANYNSTGDSSPENLTDLTALATRFATDWYLWQLGSLALVLAGTPTWVPDGLHDRLEWTHRPEGLTCRIERGGFDEGIDQLQHAMTTEGSLSRAQPTVADDQGFTVVPNTTGLTFDANEFTVSEPYPGVALVMGLGGGGTIVVNVVDINDIDTSPPTPGGPGGPGAPPGGPGFTYFNCFNNKEYLYVCCGTDCFFFDRCACQRVSTGSGSGSGPGQGSGSGVESGGGPLSQLCLTTMPITCSFCAGQTPLAWSFDAVGFQRTVWNGHWDCLQKTSCSWTRTKLSGAVATVDFQDASTLRLTLTYAPSLGIPAVSVVYLGAFSGDCCSPVTVALASSHGSGTAPSALTLTPTCCAATESAPCCLLNETQTLYSLFQSVSNCACADNTNGPVILRQPGPPANVFGPGTSVFGICGMNTVTLKLYCFDAGAGVNGLRLDYTLDQGAGFSGCSASGTLSPLTDAPYAPSCSPFAVWFQATIPSVCCTGGGATVIRILVTDTAP